jgi:hypothetical protein
MATSMARTSIRVMARVSVGDSIRVWVELRLG